MAGGPHAERVVCVTCALAGQVLPAQRIGCGVENDRYRCPAGHETLVDWSAGPPEAPTWPPSPAQRAELAALARALARPT
jgi:hypothetical protein